MVSNETRLIGLYSPAPQSGKSTVARVMADDGFGTRSFATPIKRMAVELLASAGFTPEEMGHFMEAGKEEGIPALGNVSFRYLCQTLGTEWGRNQITHNLWVDLLLNNPDLPHLVVIDDVRFPNEIAAIQQRGGEVWRITRPEGFIQTEHMSEGLLDSYAFDYEIVNAGTQHDLKLAVLDGLHQ